MIACRRSADARAIVVATRFCWTASMPPIVPVDIAPYHSLEVVDDRLSGLPSCADTGWPGPRSCSRSPRGCRSRSCYTGLPAAGVATRSYSAMLAFCSSSALLLRLSTCGIEDAVLGERVRQQTALLRRLLGDQRDEVQRANVVVECRVATVRARCCRRWRAAGRSSMLYWLTTCTWRAAASSSPRSAAAGSSFSRSPMLRASVWTWPG